MPINEHSPAWPAAIEQASYAPQLGTAHEHWLWLRDLQLSRPPVSSLHFVRTDDTAGCVERIRALTATHYPGRPVVTYPEEPRPWDVPLAVTIVDMSQDMEQHAYRLNWCRDRFAPNRCVVFYVVPVELWVDVIELMPDTYSCRGIVFNDVAL